MQNCRREESRALYIFIELEFALKVNFRALDQKHNPRY